MDWSDVYNIESTRFLHFFLPKNYSRVNPLIQIFVIALAFVVLGLLFFNFAGFLIPIGLFIILIFGLFWYFCENPLI